MIRLSFITLILIACITAECDFGFADDSSITLRHNPFRQPELSIAKKKTPVEGKNAEKKAPDPVLRATLSLGQDSLADVDGDIISIGEEVKGYRLLAVNEGSAVFSKDGKRLKLSVGSKTQEARK